jgi:hypothetical protein
MGVFDRQIAQAARLIAAKGELCQWQSAAPVITAPDKPWIPTTQAPTLYSVRILFTANGNNSLFKLLSGSSVAAGKKTGLMASVSFLPDPKDVVIRSDGTKLAFESVDALSPNGEVILWWLTIKQ